MNNNFPQTLQQAMIYFTDPQVCHDFMVEMIWPQGVTCPHCSSAKLGFVKTRRIWNCKACKKQFSVKVGTIFEDSPLKLSTWLPAIWLITNAKNGISSCELARSLGVTQKTAWFMLHRIRHALQVGGFQKLSGTVETDETFIGGRESNKHTRKRVHKGRGTVGKAIVVGLLEREGNARSMVIANTDKQTLHQVVCQHVEPGSNLYTDAHSGYTGLAADYGHEIVNHMHEYVRENVHTNGIENHWSLLKRTIKGTYVAIEVPHLPRYLDEQTFRFNNRKDDDVGRFVKAASLVAGKTITYEKLIS